MKTREEVAVALAGLLHDLAKMIPDRLPSTFVTPRMETVADAIRHLQGPAGDLVSREAVLEIMEEQAPWEVEIYRLIDALPSAIQGGKEGEKDAEDRV